MTAEAAEEPAANGASSQEMQAKAEKETLDEMTKGPQEETKMETSQVCTSSILDPDSFMSVVADKNSRFQFVKTVINLFLGWRGEHGL